MEREKIEQMLDIELLEPYTPPLPETKQKNPQKTKKTQKNPKMPGKEKSGMTGRNKMVPGFCPREEKKQRLTQQVRKR